MKIAWIVPGAPDQVTGGYLYNTQIAHGLRALGHEVDWLSVDSTRLTLPAELRTDDDNHALRILSERCAEASVVVGDELAWGETIQIFAYARERNPRVRCHLLVHHLGSWELEASDAHQTARAAANLAALRAGESRVVASADAIACTSNHSARRLGAEYMRTVTSIEPGSDRLGQRHVPLTRPSELRFLSVGALCPRKRTIELLEAFALGGSGTLTVVGSHDRDPAYAAAVMRAAERIDLGRVRVVLAGEISDVQLHALYTSSTALLQCASYEGYGMAIAEALWAGLPVLSTSGGAVSELLGAGAYARVVDWPHFAPTLAALCEENAWKRMQDAAIARSQKLPTWSRASAQFAAWLTAD